MNEVGFEFEIVFTTNHNVSFPINRIVVLLCISPAPPRNSDQARYPQAVFSLDDNPELPLKNPTCFSSAGDDA